MFVKRQQRDEQPIDTRTLPRVVASYLHPTAARDGM
jgi:hypothetical protein